MSQGTKNLIKYALIITALVAAIWLGLKWFGGVANDNVGDYDGGRSQGEELVESQLNG
ncbi:MAG: hypothetical protein J6U16_08240 [Ruminococcus sp.]|jgi:hypothetical protein|nr:hypothetical protein [Ruminococcus sp.]